MFHNAPDVRATRVLIWYDGVAVVVTRRVDLDIESGSPAHYAAFVNRIRSNAGEDTSDKATAKVRRSLSRMVKRKGKHGPSPSKNSTGTDPTSKNKYDHFPIFTICLS